MGEAPLHWSYCDFQLWGMGWAFYQDWGLCDRWHEPHSLWSRLGLKPLSPGALRCFSSWDSPAGCGRTPKIPWDPASSGKSAHSSSCSDRPDSTIFWAAPLLSVSRFILSLLHNLNLHFPHTYRKHKAYPVGSNWALFTFLEKKILYLKDSLNIPTVDFEYLLEQKSHKVPFEQRGTLTMVDMGKGRRLVQLTVSV